MWSAYRHGSNDKGFTLLEIIIAVLLLGIAIAPMLSAYVPAIIATGATDEMAVFTSRARGTLHRVGTLEFIILDNNQGDPVDLATLFGSAAEAAKETFSFQGETYTPIVAISDASGGDGGLLELTVTIGQVSLKTRKAEY